MRGKSNSKNFQDSNKTVPNTYWVFIQHWAICKAYFQKPLQQLFEVGTFIIKLNLLVYEGEVLN